MPRRCIPLIAPMLVISSALAACTTRATVEATVKAPTYDRKLKTLFVIANMGPGLSNRYGDQSGKFATLLKDSLNNCNTQTRVFVQGQHPRLSLVDNSALAIKQNIEELKPQAILAVTWQLNRSYSNGDGVTTYVLALHDAAARSVVWKAEMKVVTLWQPAEAFTEALINVMKKDALIDASCLPPEYDRVL